MGMCANIFHLHFIGTVLLSYQGYVQLYAQVREYYIVIVTTNR